MKLSQIVSQPSPMVLAKPTMESIAFQKDDSFGPQLEAVITEYIELVEQGASVKIIEGDRPLKEKFSKIVKDRLGISVYLVTDSYLAACMPNTYVAHSAVVRDAMRNYLVDDPTASGQKLLETVKISQKLGTVNTETAVITGWLSEQPVALFMNWKQLVEDWKFNAAELTAITLHELGHIWDGAAMANRLNMTNQIMSDVARHIVSKDRGGEIEYVFRELQKCDDSLTEDTINGLLNGSAPVMGVSMFRLTQGTLRTLSGSKAYNRTSFESLADSFAVRFGYGAPLSSGLDKLINSPLYTFLGIFNQALMIFFLVNITMDLITILRSIMYRRSLPANPLFYLSVVTKLMLWTTIVGINRATSEDYAYDRSKDRFARIKQNMIEMLKDPNIDKQTKTAALNQLSVVDTALEHSFNIPMPLQLLMAGVFKSDLNSLRGTAAQKEMEKMVANDIFEAASRLSLKG